MASCSASGVGKGTRGIHRKEHQAQRQKLTRLSKPKTRGGCVTCKARHVKCDETRPACLRCLKFWGRCEGYEPKARASSKENPQRIQKTSLKRLLPRVEPREEEAVLYQEILGSGFRNENEYRYFGIFRTETVEGLPGIFKTDLWERVILQACWDEEFVRDAAVAIGALSYCGRSFVHTSSPTQLTATSAYHFALQQYGRAVKNMRASLKSPSTSDSGTHLRKALVGCLLVICFENQQGNYTQALTHTISGIQLLQSWLESQPSSVSLSSGNEYKKMEGIISPNRHVLEDDLIQAFNRLDLQMMAYIDPRPVSFHERLMQEGALTISHMPVAFSTVDEARLYLEIVQRRSSHFKATTIAKSMSTEKDVPILKMDLGNGDPTLNYQPESEVMEWNKGKEVELPADYRKYVGEIVSWYAAFAALYDALQKEKAKEEHKYIAASMLLIHAKTSEIVLLSSLFGDESSMDRFLPEYNEIVALAEEISQSRFFEKTRFKFDLGIVNPLRSVAKWCRERKTRRKAIELLKEGRVREGLYDGSIMAKTQEFIMDLEEEGLVWEVGEDGVSREKIPEEMRWRITGVKLDCLRKIADVEGERLGRRRDGERIVKRTTIRW